MVPFDMQPVGCIISGLVPNATPGLHIDILARERAASLLHSLRVQLRQQVPYRVQRHS